MKISKIYARFGRGIPNHEKLDKSVAGLCWKQYRFDFCFDTRRFFSSRYGIRLFARDQGANIDLLACRASGKVSPLFGHSAGTLSSICRFNRMIARASEQRILNT